MWAAFSNKILIAKMNVLVWKFWYFFGIYFYLFSVKLTITRFGRVGSKMNSVAKFAQRYGSFICTHKILITLGFSKRKYLKDS